MWDKYSLSTHIPNMEMHSHIPLWGDSPKYLILLHSIHLTIFSMKSSPLFLQPFLPPSTFTIHTEVFSLALKYIQRFIYPCLYHIPLSPFCITLTYSQVINQWILDHLQINVTFHSLVNSQCICHSGTQLIG